YEDFAVDVAKSISERKIQNLIPTDDTIAFLEKQTSIKKDVELFQILAWHYLFKGQIDKLETYVSENASYLSFFSPIISFLNGNVEKAKKLFDEELNFHKKARGLKKFCPEGPAGLFFCLISFIVDSEEEEPDEEIYNVIRYVFSNFSENQKSAYCFFYGIYCLWEDDISHSKSMLENGLEHINDVETPEYFALFIIPLFLKYYKRFKIDYDHEFPFEQLEKYLESDYDFFRYQAYNILKKEKLITDKLDFGNLDKKTIDFSNLFDREITWQQKLFQLKNIVPEPVKEKRKARIIWRVSFYDSDFGYAEEAINFTPVQQVLGKTGKWSKGKIISLKRIFDDNISGMSNVDRKIGKCIKKNRYWGKSSYVLNIGDSLNFFLEHPFLFLEEDTNRIAELIKEPLQLFVKKTKKDIKLSLSFDYGYFENRPNSNYLIIRETFSQVRVIQTDEFHNKIIKFIGPDNTLTFPIESEKEFKELVGKMSAGMIVHSDVTDDKNSEAVKADSKIHIHILPIRNGIRAELFVRPFKDKGSYFKPGFGAASIISNISGITKQAERNLKNEKKTADKIVQKCPEFLLRKNDDYSFSFETPDEALEALSNLLEIKKDVVIEWPEGEKIKVVRNYDDDDVNFSVKKVNDWFELESEIKIDEKRIVSIKKLLETAPNSRFIELDEGEFIALTESLREKLTGISDLAYFDDENIRIHPLNAHQIDDVLSDVDSFIPDDDWKLQIEKLNNAEKLQPKLPSTLQAELRPYQLEGFEWLAKLSEWGVGACLADDMGLGKTVQALAVILQKAKNGPTLVVAPSSVCMNWQKEANKFAPTLNPIIFGTGNRKKTLKNLKPFDIVISSYGLLLHEAELLTEINWTATVLDEAQFIKNYKAKRTKAAFNLKSDFKLITTG
ncbi:MAG: SNF2-related protein, partial [Alphaproteobacteria bacterium]